MTSQTAEARNGRHSRDTVFLGLDPTDPFAKRPRPCTLAMLDSDLHCDFAEWEYSLLGKGLLPASVGQGAFVIAIDGPQGLAGKPELRMRSCERQLGTPGKSPYELPDPRAPYSGFIRGSVKLFYELYKNSDRFCLAGAVQSAATEANLIEIYPGRAWPVLSGGRLLHKKSTSLGRSQRQELLAVTRMKFRQGVVLTHDHLDAALGAWIAYLFHRGQVTYVGEPPFEDAEARVLREGYIIQPNRTYNV